MTLQQWLSIATLTGMMALFLWGRFRYDVTAIIALLAAVTFGLVKPENAFAGFSDDIVIIVGSALVISGAVQRSGILEAALDLVARRVRRVRSQLVVLTASVGIASALVKNVGALAMLMPAAFQMAKKKDVSASVFLMPMSFASLLGGLMTLIGTSPNIIVSRVRQDMTGQPFAMFDFLPTGFALLLAGLLFMRFGYRLLPQDRRPTSSIGDALDIKDYVTEAMVEESSPAVGETVRAFQERHEGEVAVTSVLRGTARNPVEADTLIGEGDILIITGDPDALERVISRDRLSLTGQERTVPEGSERDEIGIVEAVVTDSSMLLGQTAERLALQQRFGVNLIAISREGEHIVKQLGATWLRPGDLVVLQGPLGLMPERLREFGLLPLAERFLNLGRARAGWLPLAVLALAMASAASGLVPVAMAFFAAAGLVIITGTLPVRDAYNHVEWPILIMLGALIPVSDTLRTTGASDILAGGLADAAASLPAWGAIALILVAAMAVTPFLNNAATVLVMAPIAAMFAADLGYRPEAFLIATALGAGCDFLTPIGHQCNTLVLGPGGYKFSDYARLGAPLSVLVIVLGTPLILWTWPL